MRNVILDARPENELTRIQPQPSFTVPTPRANDQKAVAVLGPTLRFKGELSAEEDFILQGQLEGSINHTQSVTIGTEGSVVGDIHARRITVDGKVNGDLHATECVVVQTTGQLTGNIFAPRVGIIEGAFFNGRVEMGDAAAAKKLPRDVQPGVPLSSEETERMLGGGD